MSLAFDRLIQDSFFQMIYVFKQRVNEFELIVCHVDRGYVIYSVRLKIAQNFR